MAQVGINPGSDTPFWPHWSVETGCDKQGWLRDYRFRKAGKRTPTRDRIELLNEVLRPYKILELNLYHQFSASEASLAADHKSTALFSTCSMRCALACCSFMVGRRVSTWNACSAPS